MRLGRSHLLLRHFVSYGLRCRQQCLAATRSLSKKIVIAYVTNNSCEWQFLRTVRAWLQCRPAMPFRKATVRAFIGSSSPWSKGFEKDTAFSFYYRHRENEQQCYCSNSKYVQAFGYLDRADIRRHEISNG